MLSISNNLSLTSTSVVNFVLGANPATIAATGNLKLTGAGSTITASNLQAIVSGNTVTFDGGTLNVKTTQVNNAAVFDMAPLLDSDEAMYDKLFAVNVKGAFFVMQKVLAQMVEAGVKGAVINMASQAGRRGEALVSHYCASKAAVISYTQSAALAMAPHGIRVNGIAPGVIDTPMWGQVDALFAKYENLPQGEKKKRVGEAVPLGRMGSPADLCGAAIFLASDEAAYVTAQTLNVDGGNVMS